MNISLVPITKYESVNRWLTKTGKHSEILLKDIIKEYTNELYQWIDLEKDVYINYSTIKLNNDIIDILYHKKYIRVNPDNELYDLYNLKYSEIVYEIHKKYQDMISLDIGYNTMTCNFMLIFDYLSDNLIVHEDEDENVDIYEENYSLL